VAAEVVLASRVWVISRPLGGSGGELTAKLWRD
jgi:hypothetical protein